MIKLFLFVLIPFLTLPKDNPPGTIYLKQNLYIDQIEVSNIAWIEYLYWLKVKYGDASKEVQNAMPDTEVWKALYKTDFKASSIGNEFNYYPVVGISYEQAVAYCQWRSERVKETEYPKNVTYRLPTLEEFREVSTLHRKETDQKDFNKELNLYAAPEKVKGSHVLFLSDNVSEMTQTYGQSFGGTFSENDEETYSYDGPQKGLGFRCIAELIE